MKEALEVHPAAQVSPDARLAPGVAVGPYCVIGGNVEIGEGSRVGPLTVIEGPTRIGRNNLIYGQASIGADPQDLKYRGERSRLVIGDDNRIREFVTIHRGTEVAGNETIVGSGNLIMTGVHIAHDCRVGDGNIFGNSATLAGHVVVDDNAIVSAFSGVQQFCRVGRRAFIGGYSVITRDALPYIKTVGVRRQAAIFGINVIGLERAGFDSGRIAALKRAYRVLFREGLKLREAIERLQGEGTTEDVDELIRFVSTSEQGFVR